jgi:soluble lytic murein transglycosylase-like protein
MIIIFFFAIKTETPRLNMYESVKTEILKITTLRYIYGVKVNRYLILNDKYEMYAKYFAMEQDQAILSRREYHLYLRYSIFYDVPFHYVLAIGYLESRFNSNLINENVDYKTGRIDSVDCGQMGVNTMNYPGYRIAELLRSEINIKLGCETFKRFGKLYKLPMLSVAGYNAGILKNRPEKSKDNAMIYAALVDFFVQELDNLLNNRVYE